MKTLKQILAEAKQYGDVQHAQTIAQHGEDARVEGSKYKPGGWDKAMMVARRKDSIRSLKSIRNKAGQDYDKRLPEEVIYEMTDEEIDAHNDSFNDKVAAAHDKYITKHFGKNADVNWGSGHDEDGEHGMFTSKVFHPKHGKVYVTTHYNTKTHEVLKHEED